MAEGAAVARPVAVTGVGQRVPPRLEERLRLRHHLRCYAAERGLLAPLDLDELNAHCRVVINQLGLDHACHDFVAVLLGNAVWEGVVATVPFRRRILLLPQCMRDRAACPAELDDFGLLCEGCGGCVTGTLQAEAEDLGYEVLVAEGTTMVGRLLAAGEVEAVIGVGCLSSLERAFPHATAAAVPAIAIPLLGNGCDRTRVDVDWVREAIRLHAPARTGWRRVDLDKLREEVQGWFEPEPLERDLELGGSAAGRVARDWMALGGKRWRPFLTACVARTVGDDEIGEDSVLRRLALAVECFHKASLIHDDIEDGDDSRYGVATLHSRHGVPVAVNVGDLLIGEGYRQIARCGAPAAAVAAALAAAADAHRALCLGQGEELAWRQAPASLPVARVMEIFRLKTAPAFEVALSLGAIAASAEGRVGGVLQRLSAALGVAYQVRDDIDDFRAVGGDHDLELTRPSLLAALAHEHCERRGDRSLAELLAAERWTDYAAALRQIVAEADLEQQAWQVYAEARADAVAALRPLTEHRLKRVLFRIVHKVLPDPPPGIASGAARQLTIDAPSQGDERVVRDAGR